MDFERLERAWRSNANSPGEAAKTYLMEEMMETLKKKRRDLAGFIGLTGLCLVGWTAKILYDVIVNPFPFDPSREWAAFPLAVMPWLALGIVLRQHIRHTKAYPDPESSMPATLRALIDENESAQKRTRLMAGMTVVLIGLLGLMLVQLISVGKMTDRNALQGALLFGAIFAGIWTYQAWAYFKKLRPEGDRLRRLLADYEA